MIRTTLFLPEAQKAQLDDLARMTGLAGSEHIRRALTQYFQSSEVRFLFDDAQKVERRREEGVPLALFHDIEKSIVFKFLSPQQQEKIRQAGTDLEKRQLAAQFLSEAV
ncbi:MAG: ribbon-helix-helix domain-containing protein [Sideroxydans sp.]|jgi:predicted transcriptional regulator|nr:ribbon-helix-helix domain-containing protein [Sideroxydans sp.]